MLLIVERILEEVLDDLVIYIEMQLVVLVIDELFDIIESTDMKENFHKRKEAKQVVVSENKPEDVFYINLKF